MRPQNAHQTLAQAPSATQAQVAIQIAPTPSSKAPSAQSNSIPDVKNIQSAGCAATKPRRCLHGTKTPTDSHHASFTRLKRARPRSTRSSSSS
ncbi:hypothetical protein EXIGLDRAFT_732565 [Exidia glandulosa HHB12029]|uniref:Uncharacterized protein n=1 Tax=Exidia glandulosa HHB12029 TaxID=1314781 RepID=A0A165BH42_EXIGL|nr:hypothetical protein EXIGLDRAFT_732565 [Exidia glandulosa HHB12029]